MKKALLRTKQEVGKVIEQLPEKYRIVLVLRDLESFSTSEISAILNRKEATIRWRLAEARNRFQELWEKRERLQERPETKVGDLIGKNRKLDVHDLMSIQHFQLKKGF